MNRYPVEIEQELQRLERRVPAKRRTPSQQFVENRAEGVNIGWLVQSSRKCPLCLLGCHVTGSSEKRIAFGMRRRLFGVKSGQAEIGDLYRKRPWLLRRSTRWPASDPGVPTPHAGGRIARSSASLTSNCAASRGCHGVPIETIGERPALDKLHRQIGKPVPARRNRKTFTMCGDDFSAATTVCFGTKPREKLFVRGIDAPNHL